MEMIFTIIILIFLFGGGISWIMRVMFAGAKTVVTGESFSESMGVMPPFQSRSTKKHLESDGSGPEYYSVEVKGILPLPTAADVSCVVSLFDVTDGEDKPKFVLTPLDALQEPLTTAFGQIAQFGVVSGDKGFNKWIEIGRVFPLFLQTPHSGDRKIKILIRLVDSDKVNEIKFGFSSVKTYWSKDINITIHQEVKGYDETYEERMEALPLSIQLAMSIAMSDGSLDKSEGEIVKNWMKKAISHLSGDEKMEMTKVLNSAMKQAHKDLKEEKFSRSAAVKRLNEIDDDGMKYDTMELCYDVMAADGKADRSEITDLNKLGESLKLDVKELEKIRDMRMVDISSSVEENSDPQSLLGIGQDWPKEKVKSHLMNEFKKWNARLNSLPEGKDREHAQLMINLIGEEQRKL